MAWKKPALTLCVSATFVEQSLSVMTGPWHFGVKYLSGNIHWRFHYGKEDDIYH